MAQTPDLIKFLPEDAQQDKILKELVKAFEEEVLDDFNDSIERLFKVRDGDEIDEEFLILALEQIGMVIDIVDLFTVDQQRRLMTFAKDYYRVSGHKNFIKVVGWALDAQFDMVPLFTKDYRDFRKEEDF